MTEDIHEKVQEIKRSFRFMMSGPTAQSMRSKGLDYKINWGIPVPELRQMSKKYGKNYELAIELWKEDIRECKILATLIMPADQMPVEVTDIWMEQTHTIELAEMAAFNLYQHLDYAPMLAYKWMASDVELQQITAYNILSRLFMSGREPNERGINEFLDQVTVALQGASISLKHAAYNSLLRFSELGLMYERVAKSACKRCGLDLL
jgi:hypothetical protein